MTVKRVTHLTALYAGHKVKCLTTPSVEKNSTTVLLITRSGAVGSASSWSNKVQYDPVKRYGEILGIIQPLLELFSVVDAVFTEDNAFKEPAKGYGYGRMYEQWKKAREFFDREYDSEGDRRGEATSTKSGSLPRADGSVLLTRTRWSNGGRSFGP